MPPGTPGRLAIFALTAPSPGCATQGASYTFPLTGTAGTPVNGNGTLLVNKS
ncbi:MAG: hypothetical protein LAO77_00565 [Acidobacteriia bacterium]|nr:hypothetical protein [Terriglobia bacterium]